MFAQGVSVRHSCEIIADDEGKGRDRRAAGQGRRSRFSDDGIGPDPAAEVPFGEQIGAFDVFFEERTQDAIPVRFHGQHVIVAVDPGVQEPFETRFEPFAEFARCDEHFLRRADGFP